MGILSESIKEYIDRSILCWLGTINKNNYPNVSPKEIFTYWNDNSIIIANIASPQSVRNIKFNQKVCLSFVDILIQKGYKLYGIAKEINKPSADFENMSKKLDKVMNGAPFSIISIIHITISSSKSILAPSYQFFPDTTSEEQQIQNAIKAYNL